MPGGELFFLVIGIMMTERNGGGYTINGRVKIPGIQKRVLVLESGDDDYCSCFVREQRRWFENCIQERFDEVSDPVFSDLPFIKNKHELCLIFAENGKEFHAERREGKKK
ncbi:hypothetical protein L1987_52934 [Smallanthus sonchifolius]|uniref:Uncharacterized protein n=1 Tax=Smallanthus sonchifolius TaxID=185202 RepID=A0ACB9ETZ6_9ASTR|nr:hypothetical protein L1987_52934 [Smallanthus sonchifolius]